MPSRSVLSIAVAILTFLTLAHAHTVITYPGWRGDNLHSNGTVDETDGLGTFAEGQDYLYPYGMQWMYPCKALSTPSADVLEN
jgi:hypothetical protein